MEKTCKRASCDQPLASPGATLCREHRNAYMRAYFAAKPERRRAARSQKMRANYGITLDEYEGLWVAQRGQCANPACDRSYPMESSGDRTQLLVVDHDHITGGVRGLLCPHCNLALGQAGDNPDTLRGLAAYIERIG